MATRSNVGILNKDGTVRAVYIHFDGYPSGVGAELLKDFNTPELINARLDKGDGSTLYDGFYKGRGETGVDVHVFSSKEEYLTERITGDTEYQYLYEDGTWNVWRVPWGWGDDIPNEFLGNVVNVVRLEESKAT